MKQSKKKENYGLIKFFVVLIVLTLSLQSVIYVNAEESTYNSEYASYVELVNQYYDIVSSGNQDDIVELYGTGLKAFVEEFFNNKQNSIEYNGIYNVHEAQILLIEKISDEPFTYNDGIDIYSNTEIFFVKCDMRVYSPDKYYTEGNNYFLFYIGQNSENENKIINIEIPNYRIIADFDSNAEDVLYYQQIRNYYLYGEYSINDTDAPIYIDYVRNPNTIRVLYNNNVITLTFSDYCLTVAANEINTLTSTNGLRAAAMAVKMYAMYFVNSAASGSNYDIDSNLQTYKEGVQISTGAENAMNYVMSYFLLDCYGANFKTFYRTNESDNAYCKQYGGILAQVDGDKMGANGTSWQDILRYYYTRVSSVSYYNSNMNSGALIITTSHTHDWGSGEICSYCGAIAK